MVKTLTLGNQEDGNKTGEKVLEILSPLKWMLLSLCWHHLRWEDETKDMCKTLDTSFKSIIMSLTNIKCSSFSILSSSMLEDFFLNQIFFLFPCISFNNCSFFTNPNIKNLNRTLEKLEKLKSLIVYMFKGDYLLEWIFKVKKELKVSRIFQFHKRRINKRYFKSFPKQRFLDVYFHKVIEDFNATLYCFQHLFVLSFFFSFMRSLSIISFWKNIYKDKKIISSKQNLDNSIRTKKNHVKLYEQWIQNG